MPQQEQMSKKAGFSLDLRFIVVILVLVIGGMLATWQPWTNKTSDDRTISVAGQATVSAEPDEYVFYPNYEFTDADEDTAIEKLTETNNQIASELKELGVKDNQIKTNAGNNNYYITREPDSDDAIYTLSITVIVDDKDLAQKVQDYLITTDPTGSITPYPTFSEAKQKELQSQARDQATKDARSKADQSAKNLGFTVGKVKSVDDGAGFGGIIPLDRSASSVAEDTASSLPLQPGENELTYTVTVEYYLD